MLSSKERYWFGVVIPSMDNVTLNDVKNLVSLAPGFERKVERYFATHQICCPTVRDYMELDINNCTGIVGILQAVILEAENTGTIVLDDSDGDSYLLCPLRAPKCFTESSVKEILSKYLSTLTIDVTDFLYYGF